MAENINGVGKRERDAISRRLSDIHGAQRWNETDYERQRRAERAQREGLAEIVNEVATSEQKKVLGDMQTGTEQLFLMYLNKRPEITPKTIDDTLQLMVNSVEGDTSQLEDEHAKYAKKKGWLKGFESDSYSSGGMVQRTGFAKVHKGELVIPRKTVESVLKTNRGQGGYFRHRKEHSINRRKAYKNRRRR